MNARELARLVGQTGLVTLEGVEVRVEIKDARNGWFGVRVLVKPCDGMGGTWIALRRMSMTMPEPLELEEEVAV